MRRRAYVLLHEEDLYSLLALRPGERVVGFSPDPLRGGIAIGIEGDETTDLPETAPGSEAFRIERPYAMAKLRERLREILAREWEESDPSEVGSHDRFLRAVGEAVEREIFPSLGISLP